MKKASAKIGLMVVLVAAIAMLAQKTVDETGCGALCTVSAHGHKNGSSAVQAEEPGIPRLLDLGSKSCIPCKMMAPILEELREEYAGKMQVDYIDVMVNREAAKQHNIQTIPTLIFFDGEGKELGRKEGYMSKEAILKQWKELGIDFSKSDSKPIAQKSSPVSTQKATTQATQPKAAINDTFPRLASFSLMHGRLSDLPAGILVRAGDVTMSEKEFNETRVGVPEELKAQLMNHQFFLLEQTVAEKLLLAAAKAEAAETKRDAPATNDQELIREYLAKVTENVEATEEEITTFYTQNKHVFGETGLDEARSAISGFLVRQKQQDAVVDHIESIGRLIDVEVSKAWAKKQYDLSKQTPVEKLRTSGQTSVVVFGGDSCCGSDQMAPILAAVEKKYDGTVKTAHFQIAREPILAARYQIRANPTVIVFNRDGKEVFRRESMVAQETLEETLKTIGVK